MSFLLVYFVKNNTTSNKADSEHKTRLNKVLVVTASAKHSVDKKASANSKACADEEANNKDSRCDKCE